jgi:signal transduction histidine kinase
MSDAPIEPRWPKLLSLAVHEFRTPLTVVSGYIRMLLKDRAGAVTEPQRRLLEEAEKSCARLSSLVAEVSELSNLEAGTLTYNRQQTDVRAAIRAAIGQLPQLSDREVPVELRLFEGAALVNGDPVRLAQAFSALAVAIRREIVTGEPLIVQEVARRGDAAGYEFHIGDPDAATALAADDERPTFDEWRGGVGLSLAIARRLIEAHGGRLSGAPGGRKSGARVIIGAG